MFIHALEDHMPSLPPYASLRSIFPFSHILSHHTFFHFPILSMGHLDFFETWPLAPHCPILNPFVPHTIPLFRYTQPSHPFSIPWLSLVIGLNPFYSTFVQSIHFYPFYPFIHIKFNTSLPIHSIHSFLHNLIIFPSSHHFLHLNSFILFTSTLIKFLVFH